MTLKKIKTKTSISEPMITDFGTRKVSHQNFSRIVALPKLALQNCGIDSQVSVKLIQQNGEKFLKLSPTKNKGSDIIE